MLIDEKIRYRVYMNMRKEFTNAAMNAGFTPKQLEALRRLFNLVTQLSRVVWKEEGEIQSPASLLD